MQVNEAGEAAPPKPKPAQVRPEDMPALLDAFEDSSLEPAHAEIAAEPRAAQAEAAKHPEAIVVARPWAASQPSPLAGDEEDFSGLLDSMAPTDAPRPELPEPGLDTEAETLVPGMLKAFSEASVMALSEAVDEDVALDGLLEEPAGAKILAPDSLEGARLRRGAGPGARGRGSAAARKTLDPAHRPRSAPRGRVRARDRLGQGPGRDAEARRGRARPGRTAQVGPPACEPDRHQVPGRGAEDRSGRRVAHDAGPGLARRGRAGPPAGAAGAHGAGPRAGVGDDFGPYRLLEKVAAGGMAEVFRAKRTGVEGFEKVVAVKRILPHLSDNKEFVDMFIDEAKMVAGLTHPNIVQIFDLGRIEQQLLHRHGVRPRPRPAHDPAPRQGQGLADPARPVAC